MAKQKFISGHVGTDLLHRTAKTMLHVPCFWRTQKSFCSKGKNVSLRARNSFGVAHARQVLRISHAMGLARQGIPSVLGWGLVPISSPSTCDKHSNCMLCNSMGIERERGGIRERGINEGAWGGMGKWEWQEGMKWKMDEGEKGRLQGRSWKRNP